MNRMEAIRNLVKQGNNKTLLEMWEQSKIDMSVEGIAVNTIIESELEQRNLIVLDEETMEYKIL